MIKQLCDRTEAKNFTLRVTQRAKDVLIDEGYDPIYGARPLRRAITRLLEDRLATTFLSESIELGSMIMVDANEQKDLTINVSAVANADGKLITKDVADKEVDAVAA